MSYLSVFRDLAGRDTWLGVYTKETAHQIPAAGGCYAWFLPLWFYRDDLEALLAVIGELLSYDPDPEKQFDVPFNWERVGVRMRRHVDMRVSEKQQESWRRLITDGRSRDALQRTLLEASLLMPPLYVGKAENLKRRHREHTRGDSAFHARFTASAERSSLTLSVSDLLFVCVKTPDDLLNAVANGLIEERALDELIERILMQICRPPFSLR